MLIEALCKDRRCLVIGSSMTVMSDIDKLGKIDKLNTLIIGANGGAVIANKVLGRVDILVTTSHLFIHKLKSEKRTVNSIRGLSVESLWVDVKSGPASVVTGVTFNNFYNVSPEDRSEVTIEAVLADLWVSTGVWALCLAKASKAKHIVAVGISLDDGHYGIDSVRSRDHVESDRLALHSLGIEI